MKINVFEKEFKALGTDIYLQLVSEEFDIHKAERDFLKVVDIYKRQEKLLSRFDKDSELSKINYNLGKFVQVSRDIVYLAEKSLEYYDKSRGIFDLRILEKLEAIGYRRDFRQNKFEENKSFQKKLFDKNLKNDLIIKNNEVKFLKKMDFSGIAKGYITDRIADFLILQRWDNFLVDSGGDMYAKGKNKNKEKWGIALEESRNENKTLIEISDEAVATSGNTRKFWEIDGKKFHHLINPINSDKFDFDLKSVTVIAKNTLEADVMAKVLFLLGIEKGFKFANKNKIKSIFLKKDKTMVMSNFITFE
ncbi:MAG: FAD:protein FMN transferase [Parcubacteria group bacterium]|jgi:thiamine biosynthesis lipoprotein